MTLQEEHNMTDIKEIISEILVEPIGHHLLDSGGAYGYIYERNQKNGIPTGLQYAEEWTDTDKKERTLDVTIPVFDFLSYNLEKDEETIKLEKELFEEFKNEGFEPYEIYEVSDWLKSKAKERSRLAREIVVECITDNFKPSTLEKAKSRWNIQETGLTSLDYTNTYNYEEYLSQTLLYVCFQVDGEDYVLLEVHNGCDVRSGYTYPQLFKLNDIEYFLIGQSDRFCQCDCGFNDYNLYGGDDPTDTDGEYVTGNEIYNRTYVDPDGYVRCAECDGFIKGGFMEW